MITTTLRQIRQHNPCSEGWRTLLSYLGKTGADDDPLPLVTILQSNGLDDALWCLRTITGHDKEIIRFALACAQEVKHLMTDQRSLDVLSTLERHLESPLSREELDQVLIRARAAAARASGAVAGAAAGAAAWAAALAVEAAADEDAQSAVEAVESAVWALWAEAQVAKAEARAAARARQVQIFKGIFG